MSLLIRRRQGGIRGVGMVNVIRRWNSNSTHIVKDIEIPIPFVKNHISGKLWETVSPKSDTIPMICVHGWGDSVSAFEPLIPKLLDHYPNQTILAFDLPGHGKSYHTPGCYSDLHMEGLMAIMRIVKYFKWDKIQLLGHSFGGLLSISYTANFPEVVDRFIGLDIFHPLLADISEDNFVALSRSSLEGLINMEPKILKKSPPSYSRSVMIERMMMGRAPQGGLSAEGCDILVDRGSVQRDGQYIFTHDPRNTHFFWLGRLSFLNLPNMGVHVKCPVGLISCLPTLGWEDNKDCSTLLNNIQSSSKEFKHLKVEGAHHIHMLEPQKVIPLLKQILSK